MYTGRSPKYRRIGRTGDNSFWGIGLPTLFQLLSCQPEDAGAQDSLIPGLAWFWHTEADTIDKIDPDILLKDTRVYMAALWRLCTSPVLPFNFEATTEELISLLNELKDKAGRVFDLGPAMDMAEVLKGKAAALKKESDRMTGQLLGQEPDNVKDGFNSAAITLNACLMKLSRILMPVSYSAVDRFEADPAVSIPPLPRLGPVAELAVMDQQSDGFRFLERKMVRERNRVCHALTEAAELIDQTLQGLNL
jgi:hypothetical protein